MKKVSVAGLVLAGLIAGSSSLVFGCSKDVSLSDYQEALTTFSENIKGSEFIGSKNIKFGSNVYQGYAPIYNAYIQEKIDSDPSEVNDFNKVAKFYDFVLAYSLDSIDFSSIILLSTGKKNPTFEDQQKINNLYSQVSKIDEKLSKQESRIQGTNRYITSLRSNDEKLEKSEIYKYEQGYAEFIRYVLDIAISNMQIIDNSFIHINYIEKDNTKSISQSEVEIYEKAMFIQNNLQIIDCYFKYISEEFKSNTPSKTTNNQKVAKIANDYDQICNDYDQFLTDLVVKTNTQAFKKALTDQQFASIQRSEVVFKEEVDIVNTSLNQIDIYSLIYDYSGDFGAVGATYTNSYDKIDDFYKNVLTKWSENFLTYFNVGE